MSAGDRSGGVDEFKGLLTIEGISNEVKLWMNRRAA
jgi:hypothetical protein